MRIFSRLWPRRGSGDGGTPLLERLRERLPPGGAPGLLPTEDAAAEAAEAQRIVRELHGHAGPPLGLGLSAARRAEAVAHAGRRRRPAELAEALRGLGHVDTVALLERAIARPDLPRAPTAETARRLLRKTEELEVARGALLLLSMLGAADEDVDALRLAARLPTLAPAAARAAGSLPKAEALDALLSLVEAADGVGRALVVEELLRSQGADAARAHGRTLLLRVAAIDDPIDRAWAAAPLLEMVDPLPPLADDGAVAEAIARCLEATARGGWRGGPGPGLGRLPGSIRAAEAILALEGHEPARRLAAQAVLDSHPAPAGEVYERARALIAEG